MVVRSGFQVQLVDAKTMTPFKEHEKDGKIYVEAEPDAEYFIGIRRISPAGHPVILSYYSVDGHCLGYRQPHKTTSEQTFYQGIWSRTNGKEQNIALRFAKARTAEGDQGFSGDMGKAEITLYQGVLKGAQEIVDVASTFEPAATVNPASATTCKKKVLLSAAGSTTLQCDVANATMYEHYTKGAFIDRITLHYSSALGMIDAGLLPKPDFWTLASKKRPAPPGQLTARFIKMHHDELLDSQENDEIIVVRKVIEFVDLTDEDALPTFTW